MDAEDDREGDERIFHGKPCEAVSGKLLPLSADGGEEGGFRIGEVIDVHGPVFSGLTDAEVEGVVGIGEGGYVEVFRDSMIVRAFCIRFTQWEELHLAI